jgi:DNA polymerase III epsilon subunit-like protein
MKHSDEKWVLIDTETTGIIDPIYIIEIYAQKMEGFTPVGNPLHLFINHKVPIPPEATAIHGYTNQFIARVGIDPLLAHKELEGYCQSYPISSHNLGYDWCRCLIPERRRLNLEPKLVKGFCTLQLFRRALAPQNNYKLTTLKENYKIEHGESCPSHSARGDVLTVIEILSREIKPTLEKNRVTTVKNIKELSKLTPISLCRKKLGLAQSSSQNIGQEGVKELEKPLEEIILETLAQTLDLTEVEDSKIMELDRWLSLKSTGQQKLEKEIKKIVSEGVIEPNQRLEILEMIQPTLPFRADASKKQMNYLKKLGAKLPEGKKLTKQEASELIDKIKGRSKAFRYGKNEIPLP